MPAGRGTGRNGEGGGGEDGGKWETGEGRRRLSERGRRDGTLTAALVVAYHWSGAVALVSGAVAGSVNAQAHVDRLFCARPMMAVGALLASRRIWLFISIFNNLALLLFFKYARFVIENLNYMFGSRGLHLPDPSTLMPYGSTYVLPVGISFFTFQSMSYTIDFYLGQGSARAQHPAVRDLRLLLSAVDGGADRTRAADATAVSTCARIQVAEPYGRSITVSRGPVQEACT